MLNFAANLSFLFAEHSFLSRFDLAAQRGFRGVEYLFPYPWSPKLLQDRLRSNQQQQVLFNLYPGDWDCGERGLACLPDRVDAFKASVEQGKAYAKALECPRIHCMAGIVPDDAAPELIQNCYIDNLRYAADQLVDEGITLMIEPINTRIDMPGYWLSDFNQAIDLLGAIRRPNVKLQFDLYHARVILGDGFLPLFFEVMEAGMVGHIQLADFPGRHQPGTGEIPFDQIFAYLKQMRYSDWIGCEYRPWGEDSQALDWLSKV